MAAGNNMAGMDEQNHNILKIPIAECSSRLSTVNIEGK